MPDPDLEHLHRHALWVIMDPWHSIPWSADRARYPNMVEHNAPTMQRILDYLPRLHHVVVSCPECFEVDSRVAHLSNMGNHPDRTIGYLKTHDLQAIVYTGFHHGRCIINKGDGAKNLTLNGGYHVYVKRDLCAIHPADDPDWADEITRPWATII